MIKSVRVILDDSLYSDLMLELTCSVVSNFVWMYMYVVKFLFEEIATKIITPECHE